MVSVMRGQSAGTAECVSPLRPAGAWACLRALNVASGFAVPVQAPAERLTFAAGFSTDDYLRAFDRLGRHMCQDDAAAMDAVEGRAAFATPGPSRFGK